MMVSKYDSRLDFYEVKAKQVKKDVVEVYPDYVINEKMDDLMVRGGSFYAMWDPDKEQWTRNERSVKRIVDRDVQAAATKIKAAYELTPIDKRLPMDIITKMLRYNSSGKWREFKNYIQTLPDSFSRLDEKVAFQDPEDPNMWLNWKGMRIKRSDYISKCLPYALVKDIEEPPPAWDELIGTLYDPEEREKIEWSIGAILTGDASKIQKFLVLYGKQGTGKGTILDIVSKLFSGYCATFKAENLVRGGDNFNLDFLSEDPLVAIDADTNLSRIESNVLINQIASHEQLKVNEKFKNKYPSKPICMMMMGTNQQVKITDAKSGIIRRLIDVESSARLIPEEHYYELMDQVEYELGAIAGYCMKIYKSLGRSYYSGYVPIRMMYRSDPFFNFMQESIYDYMKDQAKMIKEGKEIPEGISADTVWMRWKAYCAESGIEHTRKRYEIIDEAQNYFEHFYKGQKRIQYSNNPVRNWFSGFRYDKFFNGDLNAKKRKPEKTESDEKRDWLDFKLQRSIFDEMFAEYKAQYDTGNPEWPLKVGWNRVHNKLKSLDTSKTHWVKGPGQLIMIDADRHGPDGKKSLELNIQALRESGLPPTYAELSNSGGGIHAHYWYEGNVNDLSNMFAPEIEIKVYPEGKGLAIRRRLSKCNNFPIAHISSGLPFKEKKQVIDWEGIKDEQHLRNMVLNAVAKNIRPYGEDPKTITCVKYIRDLLKEAQDNGMQYDLHDLDNLLESFAASSHHNSKEALNIFWGMELRWPKEVATKMAESGDGYEPEAPIIILDCEVVRNLLLVVYKELGPEHKCVRLFNPTIDQVKDLLKMRIVGHNVTGYDNHILYAALMGYSPEQIFQISQSIIVHGDRSPFREAREISYTDTLDVASEKKGLKKIEIEMHIPHKEMEIDWSKPLPESEWERLAQYCENDVLATEAYFLSKKWQADFKARKILAALTGMTVNTSTNNLSAQLIFGDVKEPWHEFHYPDLKEEFPPYRFEFGKSYYYDELIGEGGRVYAEPGMYYDVVTFDVASMHPTSIIVENGFGKYTKVYKDLYEARIAIKHKDYEKARKLFDGRLAPYLESDEDADDLSYALKIVLNSVYGMTAAGFQNRFRDPRNKDNWVAKRGALFMEKLRLEVQKRGGRVVHIKTDSIKLEKPTKELSDFVLDFGKQHGYTFEIESKYDRICLVNHAVYIAYRNKEDPGWLKECKKAKAKAEETGTAYIEPTRWTATGAQFAHPFIFKQLFSKEPMEFWDFCETKTVKTALYLDLNESLPDVSQEEKEKKKIETKNKKLLKMYSTRKDGDRDLTDDECEHISADMRILKRDADALDQEIAKGHHYLFVGKAGEFMPVKPGSGGGLLVRQESEGGYGFATGAKGYRWVESETLLNNEKWRDYIDIRYFRGMVDEAIKTINTYGDFDMFARDEDALITPDEKIFADSERDPWQLPCHSTVYAYCSDCPDFVSDENGYSCSKGYTITNQILGESKESIEL